MLSLLLAGLVAGALPATPAVGASDLPVTTRSARARALFEQGRHLSQLERWAEARAVLARAVAADPDFPLAMALLGDATPGPAGQALIDRAVRSSAPLPEPERLWIEQLDAERRGEFERSRHLALRLGRLLPDSWRTHHLIARIENFEEHFAEAEVEAQRAIALAPNEVPAHNVLAYLRLRRGDRAGALAEATQLAELAPREPNVLDTLAEMQLCAGQVEAAQATFRRVLGLDPRFWIAWAGVAQTQFLQGRWSAGRKSAERARQAAEASERPLLTSLVAWSWFAQGDAETARGIWSRLESFGRQGGEGRAVAISLVERSRLALLQGDVPGAQAGAAGALDELGRLSLSGEDREQLERQALVLRAAADAQRGNDTQAKLDLAALQAAARRSPYSALTRSAVHQARAELSLAKGQVDVALAEFEACAKTDLTCHLRRLQALEKLKAPTLSGERLDYLRNPWRDQIKFGEPPMYLVGHALVLRALGRAEPARAYKPRNRRHASARTSSSLAKQKRTRPSPSLPR